MRTADRRTNESGGRSQVDVAVVVVGAPLSLSSDQVGVGWRMDKGAAGSGPAHETTAAASD